MLPPGQMRPFQYRAPRAHLGFPIEFSSGSRTVHGECRDIGEQGLRVVMEDSIPVGIVGCLTMRHLGYQVSVKARVTRVDGEELGLRFEPTNSLEHTELHRMLDLIAPRR